MSGDEGSITEEIIQEHETAELETIENENAEDNGEENQNEASGGEEEEAAEDGEGEAQTKKVVKPKRVIKNPQPKLNEQTLKGPRGIAAIPGYFERVKLKGKGYEEQDLNVIMKTYEYWSHRLFPKFPFDASIERLEKLGSKKATKTHIKRIRYDLLVDDNEIIEQDDNEINVENFVDDETNRQFDELARNVNNSVNDVTNRQFDELARTANNFDSEELTRRAENVDGVGTSNQVDESASDVKNVEANNKFEDIAMKFVDVETNSQFRELTRNTAE